MNFPFFLILLSEAITWLDPAKMARKPIKKSSVVLAIPTSDTLGQSDKRRRKKMPAKEIPSQSDLAQGPHKGETKPPAKRKIRDSMQKPSPTKKTRLPAASTTQSSTAVDEGEGNDEGFGGDQDDLQSPPAPQTSPSTRTPQILRTITMTIPIRPEQPASKLLDRIEYVSFINVVTDAYLCRLSTEIRYRIIFGSGLSSLDVFCLKQTCYAYFRDWPTFEVLRKRINKRRRQTGSDWRWQTGSERRWLLTIQVSRQVKDTYLCAGCRTYHPVQMFEDSQWHGVHGLQLCRGRTGAVVLFKDMYITWNTTVHAFNKLKDFYRKVPKPHRQPFTFNLLTFGDPAWSSETYPRSGQSLRWKGILGTKWFIMPQDSGPTESKWVRVSMSVNFETKTILAMTEVHLELFWFKLFLDETDCKNWLDVYHTIWRTYIEPWDVPLCKHTSIASISTCRLAWQAIQLWKSGGTRENEWRREKDVCHVFSPPCEHCSSFYSIKVSGATSDEASIEFKSHRFIRCARDDPLDEG